MVKHARRLARTLKPVLEASVRIRDRRFRRIMQRESDRLQRPIWSVPVVPDASSILSRSDGDLGCQGYSWPPKASRIFFVNTGTSNRAPRAKASGKPPSPVMSRSRGGASVVVRARESRVHGEGGQSIGRPQSRRGKPCMWQTKTFVFVSGANDAAGRARARVPGRLESRWVLVVLTRSGGPRSSGASPLPSRQHRWRARCVSKGARRVR